MDRENRIPRKNKRFLSNLIKQVNNILRYSSFRRCVPTNEIVLAKEMRFA